MKATDLGQIQKCIQKTKQNTETAIAKLAELTTKAIEEVQAQLDTIAQLTALLEAQKEQFTSLTSTRVGYIDKLGTGVGIKSVQRGTFQESPLGKTYVNGEWQEVEKESIVLPPSDTELLMQSMADLELAILEGGQKNV